MDSSYWQKLTKSFEENASKNADRKTSNKIIIKATELSLTHKIANKVAHKWAKICVMWKMSEVKD